MTTRIEEDLRRSHQERTARPGREGCLSADELGRAAAGELARRDRVRVADHLVACAECAEELRVLRALREELPGWLPTSPPSLARPVRPALVWWRRWPTWATATALVTLAVVLPLALRGTPGRPPSPPVLRASEGPQVRSLLDPARALPRARCVLRWSAVPGARYVVSISTANLRIVHVARGLERTEYRVPPAALAGIPSGGSFIWGVEAFLPDGRRLAPAAFAGRLE